MNAAATPPRGLPPERPDTGVILLAMGGPTRRAEVQPFLAELFADPLLVGLPGGRWLRTGLARWIARRRAGRVWARYVRIGGSPLIEETHRQAGALGRRLGVPVAVGFRYCAPRVDDALVELRAAGVRRLVALPMYPQGCRATTGSALADLDRALAGRLPLRVVADHHDESGLVAALAGPLADRLRGAGPDTQVLLAAHSVPVRLVRRGDPYLPQVRRTAAAVATAGAPGRPWRLAFGSRVGPVGWQGPALEAAPAAVVADGGRNLVVLPLSHATENLETLYDLDVDLRARAARAGIVEWARLPAPGTATAYLDGLAARVGRLIADWPGEGRHA